MLIGTTIINPIVVFKVVSLFWKTIYWLLPEVKLVMSALPNHLNL